MKPKSLSELKNIGKAVAERLYEIGVTDKASLKKIGSVKAYQLMSAKFPDQHLPVCYYLYSLEGALKNKHWDTFSKKEKTKMRLAAGLEK